MVTNNQDLEWYLSQVYRTVIEPIPEDEGGGFEAHIPTVGRSSCVGVGDTGEEALQSLKECKRSLFMLWFEKGYPIPLPENEDTFTEEYSGKILLRTSKEMHQRLVQAAEKQGVSLNSFVNQAINRGYSVAVFEEHVKNLMPASVAAE